LYLAWTGTDNRLNLISSADGVKFDRKITFDETSNVGPSLAVFNNKLYLGWLGQDNLLNWMSSSDGQGFGNKVTSTEGSSVAPALAATNDYLYITWSGGGGTDLLNVMPIADCVVGAN
jgi:hypothetical protein